NTVGRAAWTFDRRELNQIRDNLAEPFDGTWKNKQDELYRTPENAEGHYSPWLKAAILRSWIRKKRIPRQLGGGKLDVVSITPVLKHRIPGKELAVIGDKQLGEVVAKLKARADHSKLLRDFLADGPRLTAEVKREMALQGIGNDRLLRLRKKLGVKV